MSDYFMRARILKGLHVEFRMDKPKAGDVVAMDCVWDPDVPAEFTPKILARYNEAKDAFFKQIVEDTGLPGTVVDVIGNN